MQKCEVLRQSICYIILLGLEKVTQALIIGESYNLHMGNNT